MIKHIRLFYLLLIICSRLAAQFPNPVDFNTGTNASNTGTLPVGSNDLHWSVAFTSSVGPFVQPVVCANQAPCCWINSPYINANWITYSHTCSSSPAEHSCIGNVDEYYRLTMTLPATACSQAISTPSSYCLSFDFYADNWVTEIFVNNILTYNNPISNPYTASGFNSSGGLTASLCDNWQAGTNTVLVHVASGAPSFPGWTGFLAQANQTVNTTIGIPISANISQTPTPCGGSASVTASGGGGNYTYTWIPGGGNSALASNLAGGNYSVIINSSNGCSLTKTIVIPQPNYDVSTSGNSTICIGSFITISASGASTYTWFPGNAQASSITVSPSVTTIYTVNATTSLNCAVSETCMVTAVNCTKLPELKNGVFFKIYPNPGEGLFNIVVAQNTEIEVLNILGETLVKSSLFENTSILDLRALDTGIYFIRGHSEHGRWQTKVILNK